jgi:hypothetical protein
MPTSNNVRGSSNEASLAVKLAAGTQKHLATLTQVLVGSGTFTPAQVETQLQAFATLRTDVEAAQAVVKAKLVDEAAQAPALRAFFIAFIAFVRAAFGNSPDILADFGLQPKKVRAPLTVAQKATAAAKRKATRAARGTKGPKAKLAVTGNVTGLTMTPITASAAPEPAAPPTQTAPSASTTPPGATK